MFVYRALNHADLCAFSQSKSIFAQNISNLANTNFMDQIIPHINKGSDSIQSDCWISACKDFHVCVTEYAIPQNGNFNTLDDMLKPVAVIDLDEWLKFDPSDSVRNYTVFLDKNQKVIEDLRLANLARYPLPYDNPNYSKGKSRRCLNGVAYEEKDLREYAEKFKTALQEHMGKIRFGIMDCSMPKINSPVRSVQELSVYN
ncbi:MAG: hypothetical protein K2O42_10410, partial [Oscillospiraceae bacterium]|nr:hypothetical protein [Oscillospiraceae bacterium]